MHNASWPVGGSRGVCNEEVILTVHWHWFKLSWLSFHCLSVNSQNKLRLCVMMPGNLQKKLVIVKSYSEVAKHSPLLD